MGLTLLLCLLVSTGCSSKKDVSNKKISKNVKNGVFEMSVNSPKVVSSGNKFKLDSTLKYLSDKEIDLTHGAVYFDYIVTDKFGKQVDTHVPINSKVKIDFYTSAKPAMISNVKKGFTFSRNAFFYIPKKGTYKITAFARYSELKDIKAQTELKVADINLIVN